MSYEKLPRLDLIPDETPIDYEAYWEGGSHQTLQSPIPSDILSVDTPRLDSNSIEETESSNTMQLPSPVSSIRKATERIKSMRSKWSSIAKEDGSGYDRHHDRWPSDKIEQAIAQKKFRERDRIGALRASRSTIESGVYEINPTTGRSRWRDENGSLSRYDRKTRKSIKKEERVYRKISDRITRYEST